MSVTFSNSWDAEVDAEIAELVERFFIDIRGETPWAMKIRYFFHEYVFMGQYIDGGGVIPSTIDLRVYNGSHFSGVSTNVLLHELTHYIYRYDPASVKRYVAKYPTAAKRVRAKYTRLIRSGEYSKATSFLQAYSTLAERKEEYICNTVADLYCSNKRLSKSIMGMTVDQGEAGAIVIEPPLLIISPWDKRQIDRARCSSLGSRLKMSSPLKCSPMPQHPPPLAPTCCGRDARVLSFLKLDEEVIA